MVKFLFSRFNLVKSKLLCIKLIFDLTIQKFKKKFNCFFKEFLFLFKKKQSSLKIILI